MKQLKNISIRVSYFLLAALIASCKSKNSVPSTDLINQLNLKRGNVIACGPPEVQFGSTDFDISCDGNAKKDFNLAMELLHSFEYDESEKVFAKIIDKVPGCAMAYWGVAMCNFHPLWNPPAPAELEKGSRAINIAKAITTKSAREAGYINAIGLFYKDWNTTDHHTRCVDFEHAMKKLYASYPNDKEAAIFYALSLDAAADPTDKTYAKQKKAGAILEELYKVEPNHPGVIHYIYSYVRLPGAGCSCLTRSKKICGGCSFFCSRTAHALSYFYKTGPLG